MKIETHKDAVIHFIEQMDIEMLNDILDMDEYQDIKKYTFLQMLNLVFDKFKSEGNISLNAKLGICRGCKRGCLGYSFQGNLSHRLDLYIEDENDHVIDIYECNSFELLEKQDFRSRLLIDPAKNGPF